MQPGREPGSAPDGAGHHEDDDVARPLILEEVRRARDARASNAALASRVAEALAAAGAAKGRARQLRSDMRASVRSSHRSRGPGMAVGVPPFATEADMRSSLPELHKLYARRRDRGLRDRLVDAHTALAVGLAARFAERGETMEDLRQVALMALVKAVESFDPTRKVQFSSYATVTILGELKRHFRDKRWGLRVPRTLQEQYLRTRDAVQELTQSLGRSPTVVDIAAYLATTEEKVIEAMEVGRALRVGSLDAPLDPDDPGSSVQVGGADMGMALVEDRGMLGPAVARLPDREQLILRLRFVDGLSQAEIGRRIGLSQMQVSRLLASSLDRLRGWLVEPPARQSG